jgi:hypothetical protein
VDRVALFHAVLFASGPNDGVHRLLPSCRSRSAVRNPRA